MVPLLPKVTAVVMTKGVDVGDRGGSGVSVLGMSVEVWRKDRERVSDLGPGQSRWKGGNFPCGPAAKILHSQCRGPRFNPLSEN